MLGIALIVGSATALHAQNHGLYPALLLVDVARSAQDPGCDLDVALARADDTEVDIETNKLTKLPVHKRSEPRANNSCSGMISCPSSPKPPALQRTPQLPSRSTSPLPTGSPGMGFYRRMLFCKAITMW